MTDKKYMDLAIELSSKAYYPYGAVIVKDNKIIGRSDADVPVSKTGFSHAELRAIEDAMEHLGGHLCAGKEEEELQFILLVNHVLCVWELFYILELID